MTTHNLVPQATLVVPEDQAAEYAAAYRMELVTIPPDRVGVSQVRNWIVARFPEEVVVMFDDDVTGLQTICAVRNRRLDPDEIAAVVENTAYCAKGAGARLFGWHQRPDPRLLQRNDPFSVVHWVGGVVGVVGKEVRWDEMLKFKCDIDCCLGELLRNRILWHESRFSFLQGRDKNLGGNSRFRSPERIAAEKAYLRKKWRGNIVIDEYQSQDRVKIVVDRRQAVDF
jgi:hypothetical protein